MEGRSGYVSVLRPISSSVSDAQTRRLNCDDGEVIKTVIKISVTFKEDAFMTRRAKHVRAKAYMNKEWPGTGDKIIEGYRTDSQETND